jgi:hypothetical protein
MELREKIAREVKRGVEFHPDVATPDDWREVADRILAIPEIAEAFAAKATIDHINETYEATKSDSPNALAVNAFGVNPCCSAPHTKAHGSD